MREAKRVCGAEPPASQRALRATHARAGVRSERPRAASTTASAPQASQVCASRSAPPIVRCSPRAPEATPEARLPPRTSLPKPRVASRARAHADRPNGAGPRRPSSRVRAAQAPEWNIPAGQQPTLLPGKATASAAQFAAGLRDRADSRRSGWDAGGSTAPAESAATRPARPVAKAPAPPRAGAPPRVPRKTRLVRLPPELAAGSLRWLRAYGPRSVCHLPWPEVSTDSPNETSFFTIELDTRTPSKPPKKDAAVSELPRRRGGRRG
jgi:hypothetical protein